MSEPWNSEDFLRTIRQDEFRAGIGPIAVRLVHLPTGEQVKGTTANCSLHRLRTRLYETLYHRITPSPEWHPTRSREIL